MESQRLAGSDLLKAAGIGVLTAILLSAIMVPAAKFGISPMPKPLSLAFAEALLRRDLPLPAGLLFHVAYVAFWSMAYVVFFRDRLSFPRALALGLALWAAVLVLIFPFVGWGLLGLAVSPKLIVAALVPHVLFAVFLWGLCHWVFGERAGTRPLHA
jgi:hypothetical protein